MPFDPADLSDLAAQYEAYPYPTRDPETEDPSTVTTVMNELPLIADVLRGGDADFSGFRALLAGGGTGDATVHLSHQLAARAPDAEVVHLDLSAASLEIAQRRIAKLGTANVRFVHGSLLDLPTGELGDFDYINCSGVLHHLPDPAAGARALASALRPGCGMSVMLYGIYGRRVIYDLQAMIRRLRRPEDDLPALIHLTRKLLTGAPATHPFKHWMQKKAQATDSEIVDMFLHVRDRAYSVPEIRDLLDAAGLRLERFAKPLFYDPDAMAPDDDVRARMQDLDEWARMALAESYHGAIDRHIFYAARADAPPPAVPDCGNVGFVPCLTGPGRQLAANASLRETPLAGPVPEKLNVYQVSMLKRIDGAATVDDIVASEAAARRMSREQMARVWHNLYQRLRARGMVALVTA